LSDKINNKLSQTRGSQNKYFETKPTIGFFPLFGFLGDTYPLIRIAKRCKEGGADIVFFSHGGKFENLASEMGCKIIKVDPYYSSGSEMINNLLYGKDLSKGVEEEINAYKATGIKLLITSTNFSSSISARAAKITFIPVFSGTLSRPYFESRYATFPDEYETFLSRFIPQYIKNQVFNWLMLNSKSYVKEYNNVARKYEISPFRFYLDIFLGNQFLLCDDIEFLGLKPTNELPAKNCVGPILLDEIFEKQLSSETEQHSERSGKSILLSMGSSCKKEVFLRILKALNKTDYNVTAIYTTVLNEDEIPTLNDNILLKKFVPSIKTVNENVDLAIIHGGRGTIYTAAYSAKPAIGIPMHYEQQYNLDCLVRHGSTLRLSRKYFQEEKLINAIKMIFNNYTSYLKNAQNLAEKLSQPNGDRNAAKRIFEILGSTMYE
jgi:UDP:flavonoid glycosyltransferase YjiC (YdhE family)